MVLCKCFNILGKTEATQAKATELLHENQDPQVICKCFDILGKTEETKAAARKFIKESNTDAQFLVKSLFVLEEEAFQFALDILEDWDSVKKGDFYLVVKSLDIAKDMPKAAEVVSEIIRRYQNDKQHNNRVYAHFEQYRAILMLPLKHIQIWKKETSYILKNWWQHNRRLVGACLIGNSEDLKLVKTPCLEILSRWEKELSYQRKLKRIYTFHIVKSLAHPELESLALTQAKKMLVKERKEPGFLTELLYETAYNIVQHKQYPEWFPQEIDNV